MSDYNYVNDETLALLKKKDKQISDLKKELKEITEDRELWKQSESDCNDMYKKQSNENDDLKKALKEILEGDDIHKSLNGKGFLTTEYRKEIEDKIKE